MNNGKADSTSRNTNEASNGSISFTDAFWFWLKLGFLSFGGPAGQIAMMHQELVDNRCWISERRFLHALNYCMLLPGPEAQQLATYIGWLMHRTWGGLIAGLLFIIPSFAILCLLAWIYLVYHDVPVVAAMFYGIKPAVTAIVLFAAYRIAIRIIKNRLLLLVAVAAFIAIFIVKLPFPLIVLGAAITGWLGGRIWPQKFQLPSGHGSTGSSARIAIIGDDTPTPPHLKIGWGRFARTIVVFLLLWAIPLLGLIGLYGWNGTLTQMGWFFTKAALVTFGGAYAVLPYVFQGAVEYHQWLTPVQMIDGLALGETTPGPLIMVVAFVGFVGGYTQALFGADSMLLSGTIAALTVTWFTFLPSFLFIFLGGPLVESTHGDLHFTAPLTAITAAVVGVILNLALFFGFHVLWPQGFAGAFDWISGFIMLLAATALFALRWGVMSVLAICAAAGLVIKLLLL